MKHFIAIVHQEGDSAWGVHFPDAPGCFSAADDLDQVLPNAAEALALYFDDIDVPEPRGIDAIRAEAAEDLAEGAFLLAVPLVISDSSITRINLSIERGKLRAIDAAAKAQGLNRSAFMAEAAMRQIHGA